VKRNCQRVRVCGEGRFPFFLDMLGSKCTKNIKKLTKVGDEEWLATAANQGGGGKPPNFPNGESVVMCCENGWQEWVAAF